MTLTSQPELLARATLADRARQAELVDRHAWMASQTGERRRREASPLRLRLGHRIIQLGAWIAGPAGSPVPRIAQSRP